jgi:hypothetical protein
MLARWRGKGNVILGVRCVCAPSPEYVELSIPAWRIDRPLSFAHCQTAPYTVGHHKRWSHTLSVHVAMLHRIAHAAVGVKSRFRDALILGDAR